MCYITDWFSHVCNSNSLVYFEAAWETGVSVPFDGTPFAVVGRQVLECASGHHRTSKAKHTLCASHHFASFSAVRAYWRLMIKDVSTPGITARLRHPR